MNILTWLRGFQDKLLNLALFSLYPSLFWELKDKRNFKNLQFWPENLGAMLQYWYIERGLFAQVQHIKENSRVKTFDAKVISAVAKVYLCEKILGVSGTLSLE